jgi:hypothetical protein
VQPTPSLGAQPDATARGDHDGPTGPTRLEAVDPKCRRQSQEGLVLMVLGGHYRRRGCVQLDQNGRRRPLLGAAASPDESVRSAGAAPPMTPPSSRGTVAMALLPAASRSGVVVSTVLPSVSSRVEVHGFALAAHPGKSQGRPVTSTGSQPIRDVGLPIRGAPAPLARNHPRRYARRRTAPTASSRSSSPGRPPLEGVGHRLCDDRADQGNRAGRLRGSARPCARASSRPPPQARAGVWRRGAARGPRRSRRQRRRPSGPTGTRASSASGLGGSAPCRSMSRSGRRRRGSGLIARFSPWTRRPAMPTPCRPRGARARRV